MDGSGKFRVGEDTLINTGGSGDGEVRVGRQNKKISDVQPVFTSWVGGVTAGL